MIKILNRFILFILVSIFLSSCNKTAPEAQWISHPEFTHAENQWFQIRTVKHLKKKPAKAITKISTDSKYWLWINGELAVFEGQLKRGPNPNNTYYDELDLAPWLKKGENIIAIQLWYYGRQGFSHNDSKQAGFYFDCSSGNEKIISNKSWKIKRDLAYQRTEDPQCNYRLPESNIKYVASEEIDGWKKPGFDDSVWKNTQQLGKTGTAPWNKLVKRPIPFWKDFGLTRVKNFKQVGNRATLKLPHNMQFHFWLKINSKAGKKVNISTDNFYNLNDLPLRAEYITSEGVQEYEHLPWLNGDEIYFDLEEGIELLEIGYRQTGYNSEFDGQLTVEDDDLMRLIQMAKHTLYVTMRDNYMDCPDRERAQWWGDLVLEMEESFYAMDNYALDLSRKAISELVDWQKADGTLFSPIPSGNYDKELPQQMLASIGWFGFRHFVQYSGEQELYKKVYPSVKKYLSLWKIGSNGHVPFKKGGWNWSDWGEQIDKNLLEHIWYYLALKSYAEMADYMDKPQEKDDAIQKMDQIKNRLNTIFWTKNGYRSPDYNDEIDDRGNGLAVVAGIADKSKFPVLKNLLFNIRHSSPYMEKYVEEALFMMDEPELAIKRIKERYKVMIDSEYTTLWELFEDGNWSHNHAWSGGPLSLMYKYIVGIEPEKPGFAEFHVFPESAGLSDFSCHFSTVKGEISLNFKKNDNNEKFELSVPGNSKAIIRIPNKNIEYSIKGPSNYQEVEKRRDDKYRYFTLSQGSWHVKY